jgi:hypothetical protein
MGSPTPDDDATRRVPGPEGGPPGPPESPTERFGDPARQGGREHTAQFPQPGHYPQQGYPPQGYPPPGPGGYPQQGHPQPGYPQQGYPQPGPYPQPGYPQQGYPPPGSGGYPPQGPPAGPYPAGAGASGQGMPPGGGRGNRGLVISLVVGLLLLAGVAVALVIAFTRDDGERVATDPSTSSSAAPSSSGSPSSSASPSPSTSASQTPSEGAGDRTDELLAAVPADFTDCIAAEVEGDGDVAAVDCGPSSTQPGPEGASFWLYDDTATLDEVFAADSEHNGGEPLPEGEDCTTAQGWTTWSQEGGAGGEVACVIKDDTLLILWTDREFGIEGAVTATGSTQEELAELSEWWLDSSDFRR